MKSILCLLMGILVFSIFTIAHSEDNDSCILGKIDNEKEVIDLYIEKEKGSGSIRFMHDQREIWDIATEAREMTGMARAVLDRYYKGSVLLKATASFENASTDIISDYYYIDGEIAYVLKTRIEYSQPRWMKEEARKNSYQEKYYIDNGELISFIDSKNDKVEPNNRCEAFYKAEIEILKDAALYSKIKPNGI